MLYWVGYIVWVIVSKLFFPCHFYGIENLPARGGFIVASNHQSNLDPMIIGICDRRRFSYMAKDSLFKGGFFRFILYRVGAFPVKREATDIGALKEALKRLRSGCPLVVFPEGTRKQIFLGNESHPGVGFLAVKSGVPVIPAYIDGSQKVLPPGVKFPRRYHVSVTFGKPHLYTKGHPYPQIAQEIMDQVEMLAGR